jgi:CheY-like chemotaxis protein
MGKILIVEDEYLTALDMKELMSRWGHEFCEPAVTGEEAIERAGAERPDLVLMDVKLSGELDGVQTAAKLREKSQVPIIFISGYAEEELRRTIKLPHSEIITKPIDFNELRDKVDSMLAGRKDR